MEGSLRGGFRYRHVISLEGRKETKKSLSIFEERTEFQTCHLLIGSPNRQCLSKLLPLLHGTVWGCYCFGRLLLLLLFEVELVIAWASSFPLLQSKVEVVTAWAGSLLLLCKVEFVNIAWASRFCYISIRKVKWRLLLLEADASVASV